MEHLTGSLAVERLSPAERRVFDLALEGRSTKGIAEELVVTEATVRSHLTRIYSKLEVEGRIDLLGQVASLHEGQAASRPAVGATRTGGMSAWAIGLAAGAALLGIVFPPSSMLLGPALVAIGLVMRRGERRERRWPWMIVVGTGAVLSVEALALGALLFGLATAGA